MSRLCAILVLASPFLLPLCLTLFEYVVMNILLADNEENDDEYHS